MIGDLKRALDKRRDPGERPHRFDRMDSHLRGPHSR
jgi:hypothetical protein